MCEKYIDKRIIGWLKNLDASEDISDKISELIEENCSPYFQGYLNRHHEILGESLCDEDLLEAMIEYIKDLKKYFK